MDVTKCDELHLKSNQLMKFQSSMQTHHEFTSNSFNNIFSYSIFTQREY